ncbi:MAG TPA: hypothetical protein VMI75_36910 [Polyangiaceae bacterium]|nr:hypothetical protein [Polyangiaceae bacterium]
MRIAACLALALVAPVMVLACRGGVTGDLADGGAGSGSDGSGSSTSGSSSGGHGCPAPAAVKSNVACSPDGLKCPASLGGTDCDGSANATTVDCICHWGKWYCQAPPPPPVCPIPPMHECPPAQSIVPSTGCNLTDTLTCDSATPDYDCSGNFAGYLQCKCSDGVWFCPLPDAGTPLCNCPPPASVQAGGPCRPLIETCPGGDPMGCFYGSECPAGTTQCGYEQFSCQNGVFVDVGYGYSYCIADAGAGG